MSDAALNGARPAEDLRPAAAAGMRWTTWAHATKLALHLGTTSVFAWLLTTEDFGLVGSAFVVVGLVSVIRDFGTGAAIVQRRDLDEVDLSTLFWANVAFGLVLAAAVHLAGPWIAAFYGAPPVAGLLSGLALAIVATAVGVVHQSALQKSMAFESLAKAEVAATVTGGVLGVIAAACGVGAWSLVLQTVGTAVMFTVLLLQASRIRVRWVFRWRTLRSVARFSSGVTGFNLFHWASRSVDQILIGRFLGMADLGLYTLAQRLLLVPLQGVSSTVGRVAVPLFARIQDDDARLRRVYLRLSAGVATVMFPAMAGLAVVSQPLVLSLLGPKWHEAAPIIAVFAMMGMLQSAGCLSGGLYQAKARTDLLFGWGVLYGSCVAFSFVVGLRWGGAFGVALAYALTTLALTYPALRLPFGLIGLTIPALVRALRTPLVATSVMVGAALAARVACESFASSAVTLVATIIAGVSAYTATLLTIDRSAARELIGILRRRRGPGPTPVDAAARERVGTRSRSLS